MNDIREKGIKVELNLETLSLMTISFIVEDLKIEIECKDREIKKLKDLFEDAEKKGLVGNTAGWDEK